MESLSSQNDSIHLFMPEKRGIPIDRTIRVFNPIQSHKINPYVAAATHASGIFEVGSFGRAMARHLILLGCAVTPIYDVGSRKVVTIGMEGHHSHRGFRVFLRILRKLP